MKRFEKKLENDIPCLLQNLELRNELEQKVLDRIHLDKKFSWKSKLTVCTTVAVSFIILSIGIFNIPVVHAQISPVISKISKWIQEVTNIPVSIPSSWEPFSRSNENEENLDNDIINANIAEQRENSYNYSFFVDYTKDGYSINVYYLSNPISINKAILLNQKDSPIGYQFIGSLEGEKIASDTINLLYSTAKPNNPEEFTLNPGVKAYKDKEGANIWWEQKGWIFEYLGHSNSLSKLQEFALLWEKSSININTGHLKIVEGNKSMVWVTWVQDNVRYSFNIILGNDWSDIIRCLNSFKSTREISSSAFLISLTSKVKEEDDLPIRVPLSWDPISEFDSISPINYETGYEEKEDLSYSKMDDKNYYFEAERSEDGYRIDVYYAKYAVPFNDRKADMEKNGPLFPDRRAGSISASRIENSETLPRIVFPEESTEFALTSDIIAYKNITDSNDSKLTLIWWKQGKWYFTFEGPSEPTSFLKELATAWSKHPININGTGHVRITQNDTMKIYVTWDEGDILYSYETYTQNVDEIIGVISSFRDSKSIP